jgi:hypothetical protein
MTKYATIKRYVTEYGPAAVLLAATVIGALLLPNVFHVVVPIVALAVGMAMRPRSVPIAWAGVAILLALVAVGALALGRELPKMPDDNQGLAPASLFFTMLVLFLYLAVMVFPPLWLGRWVGTEIEQRRHHESMPA